MNAWKRLDERLSAGKGRTLWQFVKFNLVSLTVTILQLLLANLLPLAFDRVVSPLPLLLRGILRADALFPDGSKYVVNGVVTWGYVLPFLLANGLANIYGYFINMKTTFRGKGTRAGFAVYLVILFALILFATWMQGEIVAAMASSRIASLSRTLASFGAGVVAGGGALRARKTCTVPAEAGRRKGNNMNEKLFDYIAVCPTAFHTCAHSADMLRESGYTELCEAQRWEIVSGGKYFVTRNGSSLIAFRVPAGEIAGFMMTAAHGDSPAFKIKENAELPDGNYLRLSVEKYGGMLCAPWLDRPLSVAGRVLVSEGDKLSVKLVDLKDPCAIIPNVAIHMNRNANDGMSYNAAVDMLPVWMSSEKGSFRAAVAKVAGVTEDAIVTGDLFLYDPQKGVTLGEYISAPRLDDLQCAFSSLTAFLAAGESRSIPVCCIFDNEEVGSETKQGAASTFLYDTLTRLCAALGMDGSEYRRLVAGSFLVSCDNAHAVHPNHGEFADRNHTARMNGGVVIKYNANQRYTSDAVSAGIFRRICESAGVPVQYYANRADTPGGSTLGNISNTQVSLNAVDIGLAQLAMHSPFETAGAADTASLVKALTAFFEHSLVAERDGVYRFL